jgi:hypothetical protein
VNDDQNWVLLPGMSFDNFDDFLAWCETYANAAQVPICGTSAGVRTRPTGQTANEQAVLDLYENAI